MEIQKVSHKLVGQSRRGWLWLKHFRFAKRRIYKNNDGEVVAEVPFTEHAYLISWRNQAIWLGPEQIRDLKDLLEDSEEEPPAPEKEQEGGAEQLKLPCGREGSHVVVEVEGGDGE